MTILQVTWFFLIGVLLTGYAILDGFDLGVGFWHLWTKKRDDRRRFLQAIGPVWDGNEVWLLTGGGAIFAAFPPVYASVFSGFYLALILVLLGLIFRAVSVEFRHQLHTPGWLRTWDLAFGLGSLLPALLFGVALGNIVRGLKLDEAGNYIGGFFALLNPYALLVGVTGLAMFATQGALYLALKTEGELYQQVRRWAAGAWVVYLVLFLVSGGWSLSAYQRGSLVLPLLASLVALVAIVGIRIFSGAGADGKAFVSSSLSIAAIFGAVGATIFPHLVPASNDPALGLTVYNSSSSQVTLTTMLIVALIGMPLVVAYTIWVYRIFRGKVVLEEGGY
jgi:cytochrome d ubiquinol oxidase subunit II